MPYGFESDIFFSGAIHKEVIKKDIARENPDFIGVFIVLHRQLFSRPILHLHFGTNKSRRLDSKKLDVFGLFAGDIYFISTLWSEWRGSNSRPPHPKRTYEGNFR